MAEPSPLGTIVWTDLTVPDADSIKDFYASVAGWKHEPVSMGSYDDFNMKASIEGPPIAGICHARDQNASLPPQWLIYIRVEDVDVSSNRCVALGGETLVGPVDLGQNGRYCVIRDPAGAACALYSEMDPD